MLIIGVFLEFTRFFMVEKSELDLASDLNIDSVEGKKKKNG